MFSCGNVALLFQTSLFTMVWNGTRLQMHVRQICIITNRMLRQVNEPQVYSEASKQTAVSLCLCRVFGCNATARRVKHMCDYHVDFSLWLNSTCQLLPLCTVCASCSSVIMPCADMYCRWCVRICQGEDSVALHALLEINSIQIGFLCGVHQPAWWL